MPYEPTLQNAKLLRKDIGTSSDKPRCLVVLYISMVERPDDVLKVIGL